MGKKDHREGKGIIMASDFSTATLGTRRLGGIIFKMLRENYFQPRILPLAKMSIKRERRIKLNKVSKNSPPVHSFSESCRMNVPQQNEGATKIMRKKRRAANRGSKTRQKYSWVTHGYTQAWKAQTKTAESQRKLERYFQGGEKIKHTRYMLHLKLLRRNVSDFVGRLRMKE